MGRKKKNQTSLGNEIKPFNKGIITHEEGITPYHRQVIDNYFNNGFNKSSAVLEIKPELSHSSAIAVTNSILKKKENQTYIRDKQNELKAITNITNANVLKELINIAYSDPTQYLELSPDELKKLPPEQRRALAGITIKKKEYVNRQGETVTEQNITVKMTDKIKAIDMINRHIGFYSEDNNQKKPVIDITKLSTEQQKALLTIFQSIDSPANE